MLLVLALLLLYIPSSHAALCTAGLDSFTVAQGDSCTLTQSFASSRVWTSWNIHGTLILDHSEDLKAITLSVYTFYMNVSGRIDGVGAGYGANQGPGRGFLGSTGIGSGAGHAGRGGASGTGTLSGGGIAYGDAIEPIDVGSGGGGALGSAGGGGLHLQVMYCTIDGVVDLSGEDSSGGNGGGSGGSFWVEAASIGGIGILRTNGGSTGTGGSGSAGRISLKTSQFQFSGVIEALPGTGFMQGAPGTIYRESSGTAVSRIMIANSNGIESEAAELIGPQNWSFFTGISLTNSARLAIANTSNTFNFGPGLFGDGTGQLCTRGTFLLSGTFITIQNVGLCTLEGGILIPGPSSFIQVASTMSLDGPIGNPINTLVVAEGAVLRITGSSVTTNYPGNVFRIATLQVDNNGTVVTIGDESGGVTLHTDSFVLRENGKVDGVGRGHQAGAGPGAGTPGDAESSGGAGHAGKGGNGIDTEAGVGGLGGLSYGDVTKPTALGSGGGGSDGGHGGSAFHLIANVTAVVDGTIDMSGAPGQSGGSGGSIWVESISLIGVGILRSNGGSGINGGGGSAGRISVCPVWNGLVATFSGGSFGFSGATGTYYAEAELGASTQLLVNNAGKACLEAEISDSASTVWQFSMITLRGMGNVAFIDQDDTVVMPVVARGDGTAQLMARGVIQAQEVEELNRFGLYSFEDGVIQSPNSLLIHGVTLTSYGTLEGVQTVLVNGSTLGTTGRLQLANTGSTLGSPSGTFSFDSIHVAPGHILESVGNPDTARGTIVLVNSIVVEEEAAIRCSGGYTSNQGPGAGGAISVLAAGNAGGGGYGGIGGDGGSNNGGSPYGSPVEPVHVGSGGGSFGISTAGRGGVGGGACKFEADTFILNGHINADGSNALSPRAGSGSGGSIWIKSTNFIGNGQLTARGGAAPSTLGGGGRIAVSGEILGSPRFYVGEGEGDDNDGVRVGTVYIPLFEPLNPIGTGTSALIVTLDDTQPHATFALVDSPAQQFLMELVSIEERDGDNQNVNGYDQPFPTFDKETTSTTDVGDISAEYSLTLENGAQFNFYFWYFTAPKVLKNNGITRTLPPFTLKYSFEVVGWPFASEDNALSVEIRLSRLFEDIELPSPIAFAQQNLTGFTWAYDTNLLQAPLQNYAVYDGFIGPLRGGFISLGDNGVSIEVVFDVALNIFYDPDYSILVSPDLDSSSREKDSIPTLLIIITVAIVLFLVIVAMIAIYVWTRVQHAKEIQDMAVPLS